VRTLQNNGWGVKRVMNLTDVGHLVSDADDGEDKMEKGARREGLTVWDIAKKYSEAFLKDFRALNLVEPTKICPATEYIEQQEKLVDLLDEKGYLYDTEDGLYFDTSKFEKYADFAHLDLDHLKAGARVEFSDEKRNASDFAVWKWIKEGEKHAMRWNFRGRPGYPGWHLECSSIAHEELGEPLDIHTGGVDHVMVHHTNEIAQSEAAFGKQFSRFWLHCNFITSDGEKISKSLGNGYTFADLAEKGYTPLDFKMWVLQGHYQSERNFTFTDLYAAKQRLLNYRNFAALRHQSEGESMTDVRDDILANLNNNLNSAGAFAALDKAIAGRVPNEDFVKFLDDAFGLNLLDMTPDITDEQKAKIEERKKAKEMKDYALADKLRDELSREGIAILDGKETIWQYK
jgi:cysteinyl-tRNA synthetase